MAEIIKHDRYFPQLHKWVFPQQKSSAHCENFAEQNDIHVTLLSIFLSVCGGLYTKAPWKAAWADGVAVFKEYSMKNENEGEDYSLFQVDVETGTTPQRIMVYSLACLNTLLSTKKEN